MTDNFERGDRALLSMQAYQGAGGMSEEEGLTGVFTKSEGGLFPDAYPIGDLIADLCHLARRVDPDINVDGLLRRGLTHYAADVIEQAWENSDGWHNCLQDATNYERAMAVMETAGVPERVREDALRYTGILPSIPRDEAA